MSERTSEWPSTYVLILVCSRPQCDDNNNDDDDKSVLPLVLLESIDALYRFLILLVLIDLTTLLPPRWWGISRLHALG